MAHDEDDEQRGDEILGFDRKRALITVGVAFVLAFGALALIGQGQSFGKAIDAFRQANKWWFVGLFAGQILTYGGYSWGYRTIARACGGPRLPYRWTLQLTFVSFGAYVLASSAGGLGVDLWAVNRAGEEIHVAGRRILAFNILEWAILAAFACLAAVAVLAGAGHMAPFAMSIGWLAVVAAAVAAGLWISSPSRRGRYEKLPVGEEPDDPGWLSTERVVWLWVKAKKGFADSIGALGFMRMLLSHPVRYGGAPLGFAIYWIGDLVTLYSGIRALGGEIGGADLVLAYATGYVVTSAPLPAGAAGFAEATTAYALHAVGLGLGTAIFAVFLYRAFTFWLPLIPAGITLPRVRKLNDRLPDVERDPDPPCRLELD